MSAIVCSAAESVLPVGVLTTITPRWVAASRSMLSTPLPARPITCSFEPASITALVTFVPERTISAWQSAIAFSSSASLGFSSSMTSASRLSRSMPSCAIGSVMRTFGMGASLRR